MNMREDGALVISLDFELIWGVFDTVNIVSQEEYFINTKKIIPEILRLFEKHNIHCTWATVGMLFNHDWDEWTSNIPSEIPTYTNAKLSAYNFGNSIKSVKTEKVCFAPEIIDLLKNASHQEIGTHTYSHYYCHEEGQSQHHFNYDIAKAIAVASNYEIDIKSLVFPRNQYNQDYLEICRLHKVFNIRSNPNNWYWKNTQRDSIKHKIFRTSDAYFGKNDKSYSLNEIKEERLIVSQKASRFLRPISGQGFLNNLRLKRILKEMNYSAENGKIYHLWWHPHNFGNNPQASLNELKVILEKFDELRNKYDYKSLTMNEVSLKTGLN